MSTLDDLINISFTPQEEQDFKQALNTMAQILKGKVVNLTPEERMKYARINNKTEEWVKKVGSYMDQEPQLIPIYLKKANYDADVKARNTIKPWLRSIVSINESLEDTAILLGNDIYNASIAYYRNIKITARQNVAGTTAIYQDLAQQFQSSQANNKIPYPDTNSELTKE